MRCHPAAFAIVAVSSYIFGSIVVFSICQKEINSLKSKAIETGAAEWVVDQKFGTTTFTWKEKK